MNDISKISMMCSFIGYLILSGNVSAVKFLYGTEIGRASCRERV